MSKQLKTCILGNSTVGKTCLLIRIIHGNFNPSTTATVGFDFKSQMKKINGEEVKVNLWDTTGQQKFRGLAANFFRESQGVFLVFDMSKQNTIDGIESWVKQLNDHLEQNVPKVLLGNKCDLQNELSPESQKKVSQLCKKYDMPFYKVSAKTGQNVDLAYKLLLEEAYTFTYSHKRQKTVPVHISKIETVKGKKGCC